MKEDDVIDRLDFLDYEFEALIFEVTRCCYYLQQIKCLMRNLPAPPAPLCNVAPSLHCRTCGHYSSRVTVRDSCPRKRELLFLGGDKTGAQLLQDTLEHGCEHAIARGGP